MKKTKMIAHRGYSQFERENTLVSFTAAGTIKNFYGIETDTHVTKDGKFIVIHDEDTKRVTNEMFDLNVEQSTYEELKMVKMPDLDGSTTRNDLVIPLLEDYLKICKKYNKSAILELKQVFNEKQIRKILRIIKKNGMSRKTIIISFILEDLIILRKLKPKMRAQWLLCKYEERHLETLLQYHLDLDCHYASIDQDVIDKCHELGISVNVWTINDQEIANKYASWGVDYITSNFVYKTK